MGRNTRADGPLSAHYAVAVTSPASPDRQAPSVVDRLRRTGGERVPFSVEFYPPRDEAAEARQLIQAQSADFSAYRQRLAGAAAQLLAQHRLHRLGRQQPRTGRLLRQLVGQVDLHGGHRVLP